MQLPTAQARIVRKDTNALCGLAYLSDLENVKKLLDEKPELVNQPCSSGKDACGASNLSTYAAAAGAGLVTAGPLGVAAGLVGTAVMGLTGFSQYDGNTALHFATVKASPQLIAELLLRGSDVTIKNAKGQTPYMCLVENVSGEPSADNIACRELLAAKAYSLFEEAIKLTNNEKVIEIYTLHRDFGVRGLMVATQYGNARATEICLGTANINERYSEGGNITALHAAIFYKQLKVGQFLLRMGASTSVQDSRGRTALHLAIQEEGLEELVRNIIEAAKKLPSAARDATFDARDMEGFTALMLATKLKKVRIAKDLIKAGASPGIADEILRQTPLHIACFLQEVELAKALISCHETPINARDYSGATAFHLACVVGSHQCVKMLLEKGAEVDLTVKVPESKRESDYDCEEDEDHDFDTHGTYVAQAKLMEIHVQPVNGSTGALLALAGGHFKVYDLLVSEGADTTIVDSNGVSCLQLAAHFGRLDYVTALLKSQQVGSAVEGGVTTNETTSSSSSVTALSPHAAAAAQVQAADRRGITALHRAVSAHPRATEDSLKICEILLSHGADVNARTVHGDAPLHFACLKTGTVAEAELLLNRGAFIDAIDKRHRSPLHLAALRDAHIAEGDGGKGSSSSHQTVEHLIELLINRGAATDLEDSFGKTAIDLARTGKVKLIIRDEESKKARQDEITALRDFFVRSIPDVGGAVKALRLARRTLALGASTSVQLLQLWKASKDVSEASPDLRRDFDIKKIFEESDGGAVSISTAAAAEMEKALVKALQDLDTTVAQGVHAPDAPVTLADIQKLTNETREGNSKIMEKLDVVVQKLDMLQLIADRNSHMLTTLMTGSYRVPTLVLIHPGAEPAVDAGCAGCFSKTKAATTSLFADVATLYFVCPVTMLPVPCGPDGKGYRVSSVKAWVRKVAPVLKVGVHVLRAALAVYGIPPGIIPTNLEGLLPASVPKELLDMGFLDRLNSFIQDEAQQDSNTNSSLGQVHSALQSIAIANSVKGISEAAFGGNPAEEEEAKRFKDCCGVIRTHTEAPYEQIRDLLIRMEGAGGSVSPDWMPKKTGLKFVTSRKDGTSAWVSPQGEGDFMELGQAAFELAAAKAVEAKDKKRAAAGANQK